MWTVSGSVISRRVRSTGKQLLKGAQKQASELRARFEKVRGIYDQFMQRLIVEYHEDRVDTDFVDSFFGRRQLRFAAVDGTRYTHEMSDLIVFFAGAYTSRGSITVGGDGALTVEYDNRFIDRGLGVSAVLPVYVSEVSAIDQTLLTRDENGEVCLEAGPTDTWVIDNTAYADYLMTLAEFYTAYRAVTGEQPVDILFLDRIPSSEVSSFYAETSPTRIDLDRECGLVGAKIKGRGFSKTDWTFARRLFGCHGLNTPPPRGEFLLPRVVMELERRGPLTREEILAALDLDEETWGKRLDRVLKEAMSKKKDIGPLVRRDRDRVHYVVEPRVRGLRERVRGLVDEVCGRIFSEDSSLLYDQRFKVDGRWLTTNDLAFLGLMCTYLMAEACWENRTLLVGVAKDTSARDLKRQLLPTLNHVGAFKGQFDTSTQDVPDTDRVVLQWLSLVEHERLRPPWATREYDTAFKTVVPHFDRLPELVSGARRNQVSLNRTFVKAYFQLTEAAVDPKLRSNVLVYDRLAYPGFDTGSEQTLVVRHDYGGMVEPVELVLYLDIDSPVQRFIMTLFSSMTARSVPEVFGHIRPLYEADKVAKYHYDENRRMIESTMGWLVTRPELREVVQYLSSFRERRSLVERTRRGA